MTDPAGDAVALDSEQPARLESEGGLVVARVVSPSGALVLGDNDLEVEFDQPEAVLEAVIAFMPAHGHGTLEPTIEGADGSYLVRDLALYMAGRWELSFAVELNGQHDVIEFTVDLD